MNELTLFAFEGNEVRTIQKEGEPWFAGKDVCAVFGDSNHNRSLSRVFGEDKTIIEVDTPAGIRSVTFINETGLYDLLFSMQPQKAKCVPQGNSGQNGTTAKIPALGNP